MMKIKVSVRQAGKSTELIFQGFISDKKCILISPSMVASRHLQALAEKHKMLTEKMKFMSITQYQNKTTGGNILGGWDIYIDDLELCLHYLVAGDIKMITLTGGSDD